MKFTVILGDIVFTDDRAIIGRVGHIKTIHAATAAEADTAAESMAGMDDYVVVELFEGILCTD